MWQDENVLQAQRDAVHHAEAEVAYREGNLQQAAELWGKVSTAPPTFEEIALKFVEISAPEALYTFLQAKLDSLRSSDKAQVSSPSCMLSCYGFVSATWFVLDFQVHQSPIIQKTGACYFLLRANSDFNSVEI